MLLLEGKVYHVETISSNLRYISFETEKDKGFVCLKGAKTTLQDYIMEKRS